MKVAKERKDLPEVAPKCLFMRFRKVWNVYDVQQPLVSHDQGPELSRPLLRVWLLMKQVNGHLPCLLQQLPIAWNLRYL